MDAKKTVQTITPLLIPLAIVIVILLLAKPLINIIKGFGGSSKTQDGLGSTYNLDKNVTNADNQVKSYNPNVIPDAKANSIANTIARIFDSFYVSGLWHLGSDTVLDNSDTLSAMRSLIAGNSGVEIARIIKAYGARKLPNRSGSLSGILYDDTYGTIRDHFDRFASKDAKDTDGSNARQKALNYIDKVTNDYLK